VNHLKEDEKQASGQGTQVTRACLVMLRLRLSLLSRRVWRRRFIVSIAPDGKVYPCPVLHASDMVFGEVPKESIWEIVRRGTRKIPGVIGLPECPVAM